MESGYYPPGAEHDPNAPYNQPGDPPEVEVNVMCSQTLSRTVTCETCDYNPGYIDRDEDGPYREPDDFSDTNWDEVYRSEHKTPLELIETLKEMCEQQLDELIETPIADLKHSLEMRKKIKHLKDLIDDCSGWTEDDIEIMQD